VGPTEVPTVELIRRGSTGPEVEDIERRLESLGYACGGDPSVFDHDTEAGVRAFQQQRGLIADGIVGPETWQALVGASYRLGDRLVYVTRPMLYGTTSGICSDA
jgi:N-acetylmuramoyl-L-alanine amidase